MKLFITCMIVGLAMSYKSCTAMGEAMTNDAAIYSKPIEIRYQPSILATNYFAPPVDEIIEALEIGEAHVAVAVNINVDLLDSKDSDEERRRVAKRVEAFREHHAKIKAALAKMKRFKEQVER